MKSRDSAIEALIARVGTTCTLTLCSCMTTGRATWADCAFLVPSLEYDMYSSLTLILTVAHSYV